MPKWFIIYGGQSIGPMTKEQLLSYGLNPQSKVWREGLSNWVDAYTIPELMDLIAGGHNSYGPSVPPPHENIEYGGKNKIVAGILAILLGSLGVQYFYLGKIGAGVMSILIIWVLPFVLGIFTCGIGFILYIVSYILSIIYIAQGIEMLCLSDYEFNRRFVTCSSSWPFF